ncbi:MAG: 16S rRNA processing protein RimM [Armatimonadetes bacterium]|nr:16S rRNA processing protein RimM [Candidatus Hippobium faecium]
MLKDNEIAIGRFSSAHGIKGEIKLVTLTEFPQRFDKGNSIKVRLTPTETKEYIIENSRPAGPNFTLKLSGIDDRNTAEKFRDLYAFVYTEEVMPLEEGREYIFNIIGMKVVSDEGEELGTVTDVITGGANDVYVIDDKTCIPAIESVVLKKDRETKTMTIFKMPGLF